MTVLAPPTIEQDIALPSPFSLELGGELRDASVRVSIYGELNQARDNAVLVCHALSGSSRVREWWEEIFADGAIDLTQDCVICTNVLGSCYGSTGPAVVNPATGRKYGPEFPLVTIRDMVRAQAHALTRLGVQHLRAVIGGSIGGMQAIEWSIQFPERVERCVAIGAAPLNALALALNHLQRQAIEFDPAWSDDNGRQPERGLSLARQIATITYKSAELFDARYGRKPNRTGEDPLASLNARFDVAGYLDHQGEIFINRFDANSYLILTKAMDTFDPLRGFTSESDAFSRISAKMTLVGISTDWLFPPSDVRKLAAAISAAGAHCDYVEVESAHGHDAFLAEPEKFAAIIAAGIHGEQKRSVAATHNEPQVRGLHEHCTS